MNPELLVSVHCWQGDSALVERAMPMHLAHGCPVVCMSPTDSPVITWGAECKFAGKRAYIGAESWTRQIEHMKILLEYPAKFFLLNDADSFMLSAKIPEQLYAESENTFWANLVTEPRPHESPYPKLASQPPYFCTRETLQKMVDVSPRVPEHPITPYIDFLLTALACEAGCKLRAFAELEHPSRCAIPYSGNDSWEQLDYRIRYCGAFAMHPVKTEEQLRMCVAARQAYEQS